MRVHRHRQGLKLAGAAVIGLLPGGCSSRPGQPGLFQQTAQAVQGLASQLGISQKVKANRGDHASPAKIAIPPPTIYVVEGREALLRGEPCACSGRGQVTAIEDQRGRFRVIASQFDSVQAEQETEQWCWAACAQMILKYHGRPDVSQAELARYFRGSEENQTADLAAIMRSMCPELENYFQNNLFTLNAVPKFFTSDRMIEDLSQGEPCVVGLNDEQGNGHACVVFEAAYSRLKTSWFDDSRRDQRTGKLPWTVAQYGLIEVRYFDPWKGEGIKTISGPDFKKRVAFIMSRPMAAETLQTCAQSGIGLQLH